MLDLKKKMTDKRKHRSTLGAYSILKHNGKKEERVKRMERQVS